MAGARCWSSALCGSVALAVVIRVDHGIHGCAAARLELLYDRGSEAAGFAVRVGACARVIARFDDGVHALARSRTHMGHAVIDAHANLTQAEPVQVVLAHTNRV